MARNRKQQSGTLGNAYNEFSLVMEEKLETGREYIKELFNNDTSNCPPTY